MSESKIKITTDQNLYNFEWKNKLLSCEYVMLCPICKITTLSAVYVYMIKQLEHQKLLPDGYKLSCCYCYGMISRIGYKYCTKCGSDISYSPTNGRLYCPTCSFTIARSLIR